MSQGALRFHKPYEGICQKVQYVFSREAPLPTMSQQELYDIFFTGKDDIRDGCIMMGHVGKQNRPVYYHFVTEKNAVSDTRTTVNIWDGCRKN